MHESQVSISQEFLDLSSTTTKIESGEFLVIAADETFLEKLPSGNWIGGTIPYFISDEGGVQSKSMAFVHSINTLKPPRIMMYDERTLSRIASDAPDHGFTITIVPANSKCHEEYAENAPFYSGMFNTPIIGWISGVDLEEISTRNAKTAYGPGNMIHENQTVAIHVELPSNQIANIGIVNSFDQGLGDKLTFPETGTNIDTCFVNGEETSFSNYIQSNKIDTKIPMVANYNGTGVNVSLQSVDDNVKLYAPVFKGVEYYFAKTQEDYLESFKKAIDANKNAGDSQFSVNCILNYLYSDLEGKKTENLTGPITFGEIAYQLLNQTAAYLTISKT